MIHTFDTGDKTQMYSGVWAFEHNPEILLTEHSIRIDPENYMIVDVSVNPESDSLISPKFTQIGPGAVELALDEPFGYRFGNQGVGVHVLESPLTTVIRAYMVPETARWNIEVETEQPELSAMKASIFIVGLEEHFRLASLQELK